MNRGVTQFLPCAVEEVLTLAAAPGNSVGIEPEGGPAVSVAAPFISIITVAQQTTSTGPWSISACQRTYCPRVCRTSISYLWATRGLPGTETHHYYILIRASVDKCTAVRWSCVSMQTQLCYCKRGVQSFQSHDLHASRQCKWVSTLIMQLTLIYQLIMKPKPINKTNKMSADWSTLTLWLEGCELVINGLSDLTGCTGAGQEVSMDSHFEWDCKTLQDSWVCRAQTFSWNYS